jgi:hypothetical protein
VQELRRSVGGVTAPLYSEEERELFRTDFKLFCEKLLKINPKDKELAGPSDSVGQLIPFRWNKAQRRVWREMCSLIERKMPLRLVVLKARQVGMSTFFCAYIFWQMWRAMHVRAAIVAFQKITTLAELNETMNTFYLGLPEGYRPQTRQNKKSGGRVAKDEVYFADRLSRCQFIVQSEHAMRGVAVDLALTTEVAFYKAAEEFYGGFTPSLSPGPNSLLVLESSPEDGYFKDAYMAAKHPQSDRSAIFIPWWYCDDIYTRRIVKTGKRFVDALTGHAVTFTKEIRAKQRHLSRLALADKQPPITDEQMWWWVCYCDENYNGDEEFMAQEFPEDDVSAFQRKSRSAFKMILPLISQTVANAPEMFPDQQMGTLQSATYKESDREEQVVEFEPEPKEGFIDQERRAGFLMLEAPVAGYTYIIGADVADEEGEDDEEGERAFSVGCVYCCDTRDQVGEWRGHIDPSDWGDELVKLGYFYNTALLILERNNMGVATEARVRQLRYPIHKRFKWPDFNVGPHALTKKEMWETNNRTKPLMMAGLRQFVKDGLFRVRTDGLQDEMENYRIINGRYATKDRPSDRIIAASLCVMAVEQTEFRYKAIVLGAPGREERTARGMAARVLRRTKVLPRPSAELPAEFDDLPDVQRIGDIFEAAGF